VVLVKKFVVFALSVLAFFGAMYAIPVGAQNVNAGTPVTLGGQQAGTADAWGGNITEVNLTLNSSTLHWQGFYGTVTAGLRLAGPNNNSMKTWSVSTIKGQVYASTSNNVDFTQLSTVDGALTDLDTAFSFLSGEDDSAANTGTDDANSEFLVGQYVVSANSRPKITTHSNESSDIWEQVIAWHDTNTSDNESYVFVGILNNSGKAFNGADANYQIIVPEDSAGDTTPTTYYFYGEII
jgi:hypothetical protein